MCMLNGTAGGSSPSWFVNSWHTCCGGGTVWGRLGSAAIATDTGAAHVITIRGSRLVTGGCSDACGTPVAQIATTAAVALCCRYLLPPCVSGAGADTTATKASYACKTAMRTAVASRCRSLLPLCVSGMCRYNGYSELCL